MNIEQSGTLEHLPVSDWVYQGQSPPDLHQVDGKGVTLQYAAEKSIAQGGAASVEVIDAKA